MTASRNSDTEPPRSLLYLGPAQAALPKRIITASRGGAVRVSMTDGEEGGIEPSDSFPYTAFQACSFSQLGHLSVA